MFGPPQDTRLRPWLLLPLLLGGACGSDNKLERHNTPPTVTILSPADGDAFRQGTGTIPFEGQVDDTFDDPDALTVTFSIDGAETPLTPDADGYVFADIDPDALSVGEVTLGLTVVDSDGESASATVVITIGGPLGAPVVTITAPEEGAAYAVGDVVAFQGEATDTTTLADDLTFTWVSDLDGALTGEVSANGYSTLVTDTLSAGTHTVTLSATDGDGEVGTDTVTVLVEAEEVLAEPGDLVFSEMMVNPEAVEDEVGEWVELYNTSGSPIDIAGYTFHDDDVDRYTLEGPILVPPHDYVVLCANTDAATNGGVACDGWFFRDSTGGGGLALANGPDELVLSRPDGTEIDWLHYDETWYALAVALGLDPARLDAGDNDDASYWCDQVTLLDGAAEPGTPGVENDACDAP